MVDTNSRRSKVGVDKKSAHQKTGQVNDVEIKNKGNVNGESGEEGHKETDTRVKDVRIKGEINIPSISPSYTPPGLPPSKRARSSVVLQENATSDTLLNFPEPLNHPSRATLKSTPRRSSSKSLRCRLFHTAIEKRVVTSPRSPVIPLTQAASTPFNGQIEPPPPSPVSTLSGSAAFSPSGSRPGTPLNSPTDSLLSSNSSPPGPRRVAPLKSPADPLRSSNSSPSGSRRGAALDSPNDNPQGAQPGSPSGPSRHTQLNPATVTPLGSHHSTPTSVAVSPEGLDEGKT